MWMEPIRFTKQLPNLQIGLQDPAGGRHRQSALNGDYTAISESVWSLVWDSRNVLFHCEDMLWEELRNTFSFAEIRDLVPSPLPAT
jgi:hypothetical protein